VNELPERNYPESAFETWDRFEEANRFWFRARERLIAWALDRYFPDASSMLEVGCGTGSVLRFLSQRRPALELCGADASDRAVELAARRAARARILRLDANQLPFDGEFDLAGAFDVIEHLDDDVGALREMRRAVRPGGGVLVMVPQHPRLWSRYDEFAGHKRRYRRRELRTRISTAKLDLLRLTSFVSLPLPALAISRARTSRADGYDPVAEGLKPPPLADLLDRILAAEAAAIRGGLSLPVGGSLFAVARRPSGG